MMFFALVLLVYGSLQLFFAWRAVTALRPGRVASGGIYLWAALMTASPLLYRTLDEVLSPGVSTLAGAVIFGWMGFSFIAVWLLLSASLLSMLARWRGWASWPSPKNAFRATLLLAALLSLLSIYEAFNPRVREVVIRTAKLPPGAPPLRIVQISDVHLGLLMGAARFRPIAEKIRALQPDILVSTGDLVDGRAHHLEGLSQAFNAIQPRLGKYAVTGNHEFYIGVDEAVVFHQAAGFKVLRAQAAEVGPIRIAGVDDPGRARVFKEDAPVLKDLPRDQFVLLLKHQPVPDPGALGMFDLQLSGHTHGGQIFPFGGLVRVRYPYLAGLFALSHGSQLYVSRGTGTWGPPMRLFAPSEITVFTLQPAP